MFPPQYLSVAAQSTPQYAPHEAEQIKQYQQWLSDAFDKALTQLSPKETIYEIKSMDNIWRNPPPPVTEAVLDHAFNEGRTAAQVLIFAPVAPTLRPQPKKMDRYKEKSDMGINQRNGRTDRGFKAINDFMACRIHVGSVSEMLHVRGSIIKCLGNNDDISKTNYKSAPTVVIPQSTQRDITAILNIYFRDLGHIMEVQIQPPIASLIFSQNSKYERSEKDKKQHVQLTGQFWKKMKKALLAKDEMGKALVDGKPFLWRQDAEDLWKEKHGEAPDTQAAKDDREFLDEAEKLLERDLPEY